MGEEAAQRPVVYDDLEIIPPFANAFPGKSVDGLVPQDFSEYRMKLAGRYSPNTLDRHIINIRAMLNWAYRTVVPPVDASVG